jgi:hypothetical protein
MAFNQLFGEWKANAQRAIFLLRHIWPGPAEPI